MNIKKLGIVSLLVIFIEALMLINPIFVNETGAFEEEKISGNSKTAHELVKDMKIGYNIGNTLDSANYKKEFLGTEKGVSYYETLWHNPQITEDLIVSLKNAGFDSIRLPVTYYDHINNDGTIDELWLKRVEEVVNLIIKNDMYCIMDIHHDSGLFDGGSWIKADASNYEKNANNVKKIWLQIATRFKDYDYRLIFEGFNEIVDSNKNYSWDYGYENVLTVNKLNQVFVDTVRSTGSKNLDRFLIVSTYAAITDEQKLSAFKKPVDIASDKIILGLHDYASTEDRIEKMFERIKRLAIDKEIPVMLDEFGTKNSMAEDVRSTIAKKYVSMARSLNIPCFWWDNGGDYALINRNDLTWKYESIKNAMMSVFIDDDDQEKPVIPPKDDDNKEEPTNPPKEDEESKEEPIIPPKEEDQKEPPKEDETEKTKTENKEEKNPVSEKQDHNIVINEPKKEEIIIVKEVSQNTVSSNNKTSKNNVKNSNINTNYNQNSSLNYDNVEQKQETKENAHEDGLSVNTISNLEKTISNEKKKEENNNNNKNKILKSIFLLVILILIIVINILLSKKQKLINKN